MDERRKAEGKKARDDKDKVMEMLFAAFEKHQYYNIKDLQKLTRQPIVRRFKVVVFIMIVLDSVTFPSLGPKWESYYREWKDQFPITSS